MKTQHNTTQHKFLKILTLLVMFFATTTLIKSQTCCDGNDTIYIENKVDCRICIIIMGENGSGGWDTINPSGVYMRTHLPYSTTLCPNYQHPTYTCCAKSFELRCGGPSSPQMHSLYMGTNCANYSRFKFIICTVGTTTVGLPQPSGCSPFPCQNTTTSDDSNTYTVKNFSPSCCFTNGIDFNFDCNNNKLSLICH